MKEISYARLENAPELSEISCCVVAPNLFKQKTALVAVLRDVLKDAFDYHTDSKLGCQDVVHVTEGRAMRVYGLSLDTSKHQKNAPSLLIEARKQIIEACSALKKEKKLLVDLSFEASEQSLDPHLLLQEWVCALILQYNDPGFLKSRDHTPVTKLPHVDFLIPSMDESNFNQTCASAVALARAINKCTELGNMPPNICSPEYLAQEARNMAKQYGLKVECHNEKALEDKKMSSLLSVAKGSQHPAYLIEFRHKGGPADQPPICLVGKAVTFDTGGISLKPAASMDEMKFDMCGGATVFACMQLAAEMNLPINLVGLVACVENMPGGKASRPGDVVKSMSGLSIEILNTDAEGRLILCDTLTYSKSFAPRLVIDFATLTGACVVALGSQASGLFSNHQELADELIAAGEHSADRLWQLPIWDEYGQLMESRCADIANVGGREAGSITAAWFLSQFATELNWAHVDIAGTAWVSGKNSQATGRPVRMMHTFLQKK